MPITNTPLRYPGGKTQLYSFVKELIRHNSINQGTYVEPFSGGSGVAISLLLNNDIENIIINDLDPSIHAFWFSVLNNTNSLIDRINSTPITIEEWHRQKEIRKDHREESQSIENAFSTFYLNRTNRSGIIEGGPIGGYEQEGAYKLDCRYTKPNLIQKIRKIAEQRDRIRLYNLDGKDLIQQVIKQENTDQTFCFFDPPYYKQGKTLYSKFFKDEDHRRLHDSIVGLEDYYWITTYDYSDNIRDIYSDCRTFSYQLRYTASVKRKAKEYLFTNEKTLVKSFGKIILEE